MVVVAVVVVEVNDVILTVDEVTDVMEEVMACVVVAVTDGKVAVEEATACDSRHLQHFWASLDQPPA